MLLPRAKIFIHAVKAVEGPGLAIFKDTAFAQAYDSIYLSGKYFSHYT